MVSLLCETDFTAKSDAFKDAVDGIADAYLKHMDADPLEKVNRHMKDAKGILDEIKAQTGEKVELGQTEIMTVKENMPVFSYVHFDNKKAALVVLNAYSTPYELQQLGLNLAMHVVASKPRFCLEEDIDWSEADLTIPEKLLNKPKEILDKISRGKKDKFKAETCMMHQPYCLDDSMDVQQAIFKVRKNKMMEISLKQFKHIEIGD
jgi:elongation factor Ts